MNVLKHVEKDCKVYTTELWTEITKIELCSDGIVLKRDKIIIAIEKPVENKSMYVIKEAKR